MTATFTPFTLTQALNIPEPYATKVLTLFKPWHPFLFFDCAQMEDDLVFQIGFRNVLCNGLWTGKVFPKTGISGMFPLAEFEDPAAWYGRLELHVFRCLMQMLAQALNYEQTLLGEPLAPGGLLNWEAVMRWLRILTLPLGPWFHFGPVHEGDQLVLMASQPVYEVDGQIMSGWGIDDHGDTRPWHRWKPFTLCYLDLPAATAECFQIAQAQGEEVAERLLRRLLLERMANALYFMRFEVP